MTEPTSAATAQAHEGPIELGRARNLRAPAGVGVLQAAFVRYPGCQQLKVWLPLPAHHAGSGYGELCVRAAQGQVLERAPVAQRLNGSVQILFDTLAWPPGAYVLQIDHDQGWQHELPLHKRPEGEPLSAMPEVAAVEDQDQDLALRASVLAQEAARWRRRVVQEGTARSGHFIYIDGPLRIRFPCEMGGAGCRLLLELPPAEAWEAQTGTALAQREAIVQFVAEQVTQQAGTRFEIGARSIAIY